MARVTVEDCLEKIPNRFELVVCASQRSREISGGHELVVERDRDKDPVVALREIAGGFFTAEQLRERRVEAILSASEREKEEEAAATADDESVYMERRRRRLDERGDDGETRLSSALAEAESVFSGGGSALEAGAGDDAAPSALGAPDDGADEQPDLPPEPEAPEAEPEAGAEAEAPESSEGGA